MREGAITSVHVVTLGLAVRAHIHIQVRRMSPLPVRLPANFLANSGDMLSSIIRRTTDPPPKTRQTISLSDPSAPALFGSGPTLACVAVNEHAVMGLSSGYRAVSLIAGSIAPRCRSERCSSAAPSARESRV